jgi:hypothetical protein
MKGQVLFKGEITTKIGWSFKDLFKNLWARKA